MKAQLLTFAGLAGLIVLAAEAQDTDPTALQDVIIVTGARDTTPTRTRLAPQSTPVQAPDPATLMSRVPGGANVSNGALSGQPAYRGLFGPRLNVRVDGQSMAYACPNLMDPPMHNAPMVLIAALEIDRGVSPVRDGPGLGGGVNAVMKRAGFTTGLTGEPAGARIERTGDFASTGTAQFSYDVSLGARSVDESADIGGVAGIATDRVRFNALYAREQGGDYESPDGTVRASRFDRLTYGLSAGWRPAPNQEFGLDWRRLETGVTGTPSLPMDIVYVDSDTLRADYRGVFSAFELEARLGWSDTEHIMSNFLLRPVASPASQRATDASSTVLSGGLAIILPEGQSGRWRFGLDGESVTRTSITTNPANAGFLVGFLVDATLDRQGAYAEWAGDLGPFESEIGARLDRYETDAGAPVLGPAIMGGSLTLANAFAATDRSQQDTTLDLVARLWTPAGPSGLSWRMTLARKTRVPEPFERYLWLPGNATGGLADGNIYVGDPDLAPETALIAEFGFDYAGENAFLRPTLFIREIDDYIQGVPYDATPGVIDSTVETVSNMGGDPTPLRFANVDARLYGLDLDAGLRLSEHWRLDAVASWVRGERRDVDDSLYRIAPPSLTATLTWETGPVDLSLESRLVAAQEDVSVSNSEATTDGYGLVTLYGTWRVRDGVSLSAGVENVFDESYADHLAGYNRVGGSDVPVGERLPGAGRGAFIRLSVSG